MHPLQPSTLPTISILKRKACLACRARKVKCNRGTPCATCTTWNIACHYPPPQRTCRRLPKKTHTQNAPVSSTATVSQLQTTSPGETFQLDDKTRALLAWVPADNNTVLQFPSSELPHHNLISPEAAQGLQQIRESLQTTLRLAAQWKSTHPAVAATLFSQSSQPVFTSVPQFPFDSFLSTTGTLHPSPSQLATYRSIFHRNIDPLIKVLHSPSTDRLFQKALQYPSHLKDGESALLFTVYLSSLCSITDTEATISLGGNISKPTAVATYKAAIEHALTKADFLSTNDLTTLQAFILYLSLSRFTPDKARVWPLTGLPSRLLPTEGIYTPFEQEMRKRLHMALWYIEHRAREDRGCGSGLLQVAIQDMPVNVRDIDLTPGMVEPPVPYQGWTEVSFCLMQVEIACATGLVGAAQDGQMKESIIDACEARIENEYLRYCDGSEGVHWLARHVGYVLVTELRFQVRGGYTEDRLLSRYGMGSQLGYGYAVGGDKLFLDAVEILDTARRIQREPQAAQWSWLLTGYQQFWPLLFLLQCLCRYHDGTDRAWEVAERSFGRWNGQDKRTKGYFDVLRRFWDQAQVARGVQLAEWFGVEESWGHDLGLWTERIGREG